MLSNQSPERLLMWPSASCLLSEHEPPSIKRGLTRLLMMMILLLTHNYLISQENWEGKLVFITKYFKDDNIIYTRAIL